MHQLDCALADLRHAYSKLANEQVVKQRMLANGLIAPAIRRLERFIEGVRD